VAGKLTIKVHPATADSAELTVADALRQVLDLVELLEQADNSAGQSDKIVWRLSKASTNTPFTVEAEPRSADPAISVALQARRAESVVRSTMDSLMRGELDSEWLDDAAAKVAKRFFARNTNGVGRTDVDFEGIEAPLIIVHATARQAVLALERRELDLDIASPDLTRTEYGSVECEIIGAIQHYGSPSLTAKHRLSGDRFPCVLSKELAERIGPEHNWTEVWSGKRALVGGAIHYDEAGRLRRLDAEQLQEIVYSPPEIIAASNADMTGGLSPKDYLSHVWGEDGQS